MSASLAKNLAFFPSSENQILRLCLRMTLRHSLQIWKRAQIS